jgi:hypothetical protein
MALSITQPECSVCGDHLKPHMGDYCGRCQEFVCRACSRARGLSHETVLCIECAGTCPTGFRATPLYRILKRMAAA